MWPAHHHQIETYIGLKIPSFLKYSGVARIRKKKRGMVLPQSCGVWRKRKGGPHTQRNRKSKSMSPTPLSSRNIHKTFRTPAKTVLFSFNSLDNPRFLAKIFTCSYAKTHAVSTYQLKTTRITKKQNAYPKPLRAPASDISRTTSLPRRGAPDSSIPANGDAHSCRSDLSSSMVVLEHRTRSFTGLT